jgi:RHS repeat-associated protein
MSPGANLCRFSSKEFHPKSGLYYYIYRFYHPTLLRWINRDPLGEDGGINLYEFVLNSPTSGHDAYGLKSRYADCMEDIYALGKKVGGDLVSACLDGSGCKTKAECEKCLDWADKACSLYADEKRYDSCVGKDDCCKAETKAIEDIKKKIQSGPTAWSDLDTAYKDLGDCLTRNSGPDGKPDIRKGDEQILPDAKKKCQKFP